jgi:type II secretory pathway pseudopilin PulG
MGDTRPSRPATPKPPENKHARPGTDTQPVLAGSLLKPGLNKKRNFRHLLLALLIVGVLAAASGTGALAAYRSAMQALHERQALKNALVLTDQFNRGKQDLEAGRYEVARQRFEFVLSEDPNFPGAADKLAEVVNILVATATPTPSPTSTLTPTPTATITPTPTRDPRPLQDLLAQADAAISSGDWNLAIDTLSALRTGDATYAVTQVDGMLFIALRNRGVNRIFNERDLEGGAYDLSLAERFGPIDGEASYAREMVRLYMYGSAFWEAYPEQAVYYFGQVASAAPYLTDASGWTSSARYRASLIHLGDKLAREEDWCNAQLQYELALSYGGDGDLEAAAANAAYECSPPTETPTIAPTLEPTIPPTAEAPPSATLPPAPTETAEPPAVTDTPAPPAETPTLEPTVAPTAELTPTSEPPTATPEATPTPTESPTPARTARP